MPQTWASSETIMIDATPSHRVRAEPGASGAPFGVS